MVLKLPGANKSEIPEHKGIAQGISFLSVWLSVCKSVRLSGCLTVCQSETWDVNVLLKPQPPCSSCGFIHVLRGTGTTDEMLTQCECVRLHIVSVFLHSVVCGLQSV